jgi:hypothetical protein
VCFESASTPIRNHQLDCNWTRTPKKILPGQDAQLAIDRARRYRSTGAALFVVGRRGVFDLFEEGAGGEDGGGGIFGCVGAGVEEHVSSTEGHVRHAPAFLRVNSPAGEFSGAGGVTSAAKAGKGGGLFCHG